MQPNINDREARAYILPKANCWPGPSFHSAYLEHVNNILSALKDKAQSSIASLSFETDEIRDIIKSLERNKAAGPDGIDPEQLIFVGQCFITLITSLFNYIVKAGFVPTAFLCGYTLPILKGPNMDSKNYI